jgi:2-amino-4-hydroxy-6-hydroxymethyldihydropteridine diphosphokinase
MSRMSRWCPAYIGIGSNLQGPVKQIENATDLLANIPRTRLVSVSSKYRSAPFGGVEQPDFVNAVAAVLTRLSPLELLAALQDILDLLVYSDQEIDEPGLTVPHPGIGERNFVLLPLGEIAPELVVPGLGRVAGIPVSMEEPSVSRIT